MANRSTGVFDPARAVSLDLYIQRARGSDGYNLTLEVHQGADFTRQARWIEAPKSAVDGAIALVAHRSERKQGMGWTFGGLKCSVEGAERAEWIEDHPGRARGPVLACTYTIDRDDAGAHALALIAHMPPETVLACAPRRVASRGSPTSGCRRRSPARRLTEARPLRRRCVREL